MNNNFKEKLSYYKNLIEDFLQNSVKYDETEKYKIITEAMRYSLLGGGKRLRGALVLAFYEELGGKTKDALPFASAIEMVHAYSLIHDDLPCMDDDDMRRGKPSSHIKFGYANALLAGDALLTYAFEFMTREESLAPFEPKNALRAIHALSKNAGYSGMVGGQVLDLEAEEKTASLSDMEYINSLKTGRLITAACLLGAELAGVSRKKREAIISYGQNLGIAFQIADDILDVVGTEKDLGKPIGSDKENKKPTYASVYGTEKAEEIALSYSEKAINALKSIGIENDFLFDLAVAAVKRKN